MGAFDPGPTATIAQEIALDALAEAIRAADPERAVERSIDREDGLLRVADVTYDLSEYDRILVVGGGKAAAGLVRGIAAVLGPGTIEGGIVVVPAGEAGQVGPIDLEPGGHPVPTPAGVAATRRGITLARSADRRTLVLAPVTGGASALFAAPVTGVSLDRLRTVTRQLLDAGAPIQEINTVRKHLSAVKGGGLAAEAAPATVLGLLVSDVVGDDKSTIGSGPTALSGTDPGDALAVLDRYGLETPVVRARLERESSARPTGNGPPDEFPPIRGQNRILADSQTALRAARGVAADRGFDARVLSSRVRGEAREQGRVMAALARGVRDCGHSSTALLSGGETTVTVSGSGDGGPNLEFALAAALELAAQDVGTEVAIAAADTDGQDGSTRAAGALVDGTTVDDLTAGRDALNDNDALSYLSDRDAILRTGPTGTNVNDIRIAVVE